MNMLQVFAVDVQPARMGHCANGKQHLPCLVHVTSRANEKTVRTSFLDSNHLFIGVYLEVFVEYEVNVMRQQLFACGFFAYRTQAAFSHLQLVWCGKKCSAH